MRLVLDAPRNLSPVRELLPVAAVLVADETSRVALAASQLAADPACSPAVATLAVVKRSVTLAAVIHCFIPLLVGVR